MILACHPSKITKAYDQISGQNISIITFSLNIEISVLLFRETFCQMHKIRDVDQISQLLNTHRLSIMKPNDSFMDIVLFG